MNFTYQDKGNYFRGLLILIGKDRSIHFEERKEILKIGKKLGYEKKFCDQAVDEFLVNQHIQLEPPIFSEKEIAINFLEDAINLSLVDNDFHIEELEWLQNVATVNKIENDWIDKKLRKTLVDIRTGSVKEKRTLELNNL